MSENTAVFNFEKSRKIIVQKISIRLRNPELTKEQRIEFLKKLEELATELPAV
jgi:ribosome recycling factor